MADLGGGVSVVSIEMPFVPDRSMTFITKNRRNGSGCLSFMESPTG